MSRTSEKFGFSLIEIMITMSLMAIVVTLGGLFWKFVISNYSVSINQFELTDKATFAARNISTELRQAEEAMNGAFPLELLEDNQLAFYADVDNDDLIERRRYFLDNGNLKLGIIKPEGNPPTYPQTSERVTLVVEQIDASQLPLFVYYNGGWPADQTNNPLGYWQRPLETRMVRIRIPIFNQSDLAGRRMFVAENLVSIRNLKDN